MADNWLDSSSRTRHCLDSVGLLQDTQTIAATTTTAASNVGGGTGANTSLHMMGLGTSSPSPPQPVDWNHALFRGDQKSGSGFLNLLHDQDNSLSLNTNNFHDIENNQWTPQKMHLASSEKSSSDFKQINVWGFQLDQPKQDSDNESVISSQGLNSCFQNMDLYGTPSTIMQSLFGNDNNQCQHEDSSFDQNQEMCYSFYQSNYGGVNLTDCSGGASGSSGDLSTSSWSKFSSQPQVLEVNSPSKVQLAADIGCHQLHLVNNARYWNVSTGDANNIRSSLHPSVHMKIPLSCLEVKPKINSRVVEGITSGSPTKRPREENQLTLLAVEVNKEKMGDRITALQQLLSPFAKTDTASVLSETTEYIKFLHEQVSVLGTPYMKEGACVCQQQQQQQRTPDKQSEGPTQDLRSHVLCLVPVSSTFLVTRETPVDFWTPTFTGPFR